MNKDTKRTVKIFGQNYVYISIQKQKFELRTYLI